MAIPKAKKGAENTAIAWRVPGGPGRRPQPSFLPDPLQREFSSHPSILAPFAWDYANYLADF
jgi:hypothetical protein